MESENREPRFAICINNEGYADYLYPASYFVVVDVPAEAAEALLLAAA